MPSPVKLPDDCTLLSLRRGALLVSRGHSVFCRIPPGEVEVVRLAIAREAPLEALSQKVRHDLEAHGFFGPPRPSRPDPPTVQIQLTNACNLPCAYCCTNSGRRRANEVGLKQMLQVVRQIPEALGSQTSVALLGGEPLTVPWLFRLADEILKANLPLTIFTNGVPLANQGRAEQTARLIRKGAKVRVSLSGPTRESSDSISGARRFEAALAGIQKLAALGCQVTVDLMFMPQHVEAISRELPALRKRLPAGTPLTFGMLYLGGREGGEHLFESRAELEEALDRVAFETGEVIPASKTSPTAYRREGCGCAMGNHVHIRSDGALFNCFKMEEKVGHLDTNGFIAAARWIRDHPRRATHLPVCQACPLATLCGGGCRSENLLYSGNPDKPPCGPWRVRALSELLAEDRVTAVELPLASLVQEARRRGIDTPDLEPRNASRHLIEV